MLRLWRELGSGTQIADPDAWAFRTLYRVAVDSHRFRRRLNGLRERLSRVQLRNASADDPAQRVDVDGIWREVDRLPQRQRAVLYLRYRADLPYERIGVALSISASSARGQASTGLAALRQRLCWEAER